MGQSESATTLSQQQPPPRDPLRDLTHAVYKYEYNRKPKNIQQPSSGPAPYLNDPTRVSHPYLYSNTETGKWIASCDPPKNGRKRLYTGDEIGLNTDALFISNPDD